MQVGWYLISVCVCVRVYVCHILTVYMAYIPVYVFELPFDVYILNIHVLRFFATTNTIM